MQTKAAHNHINLGGSICGGLIEITRSARASAAIAAFRLGSSSLRNVRTESKGNKFVDRDMICAMFDMEGLEQE